MVLLRPSTSASPSLYTAPDGRQDDPLDLLLGVVHGLQLLGPHREPLLYLCPGRFLITLQNLV